MTARISEKKIKNPILGKWVQQSIKCNITRSSGRACKLLMSELVNVNKFQLEACLENGLKWKS